LTVFQRKFAIFYRKTVWLVHKLLRAANWRPLPFDHRSGTYHPNFILSWGGNHQYSRLCTYWPCFYTNWTWKHFF